MIEALVAGWAVMAGLTCVGLALSLLMGGE